MSEEVHGSVQGPNGERLQLQIGSKSIGLQVRDLIPVLLLIGLSVGSISLSRALQTGRIGGLPI